MRLRSAASAPPLPRTAAAAREAVHADAERRPAAAKLRAAEEGPERFVVLNRQGLPIIRQSSGLNQLRIVRMNSGDAIRACRDRRFLAAPFGLRETRPGRKGSAITYCVPRILPEPRPARVICRLPGPRTPDPGTLHAARCPLLAVQRLRAPATGNILRFSQAT